ncbi:MAG TPA: MerR family transcriptional regulator [Pseudonocardiaceae bacterium]|nr:MerR family transcriptional regulator [Pseudonocardiaceae bacterium]
MVTRLDSGDGAPSTDPPGDPGEPMLPVAAVARRLGVAPATLRTWARRYGLGPTGHATGRHRRYDAEDIARLELMQRALLRGVAPAEAARYALASPPRARSAPPVEQHHRHHRPSGISRIARGLGRAVLAMDSVATQALLADAIEVIGVARAWDEVIRPAAATVAARWTATGGTGGGREAEYLFRECVLAALLRATPPTATPRNPRPVILACTPGERHSLPLYGLAAALAVKRLGTRMLGAAVPALALAGAVGRTEAAAVVLWAQLPDHADAAPLATLPRPRSGLRLFLGGPGWVSAGVRPHQLLPEGMAAAVGDIEDAVQGPVP